MRRGFTLIELLAVIVILAVIALIATPIILGLVENARMQAFKDTAYGLIDATKGEYIKTLYKNETPSDMNYTYASGVETSSIEGKNLSYTGAKPQNGKIYVTQAGDIAIVIHDGTNCAYKGYDNNEVTVEKKTWTECESILNSLVVVDTDYDAAKGVNRPKLATGMIPIKWNETTWTETTPSDSDWYSYDTTNKKWANARTADGSMWVWIPRYIYKITSGWHSNIAGDIEVQFSKGTNDNWNSAVIGAINADTTSNASHNTWTNHPGFTFGSEMTGIWVAKFEASKEGTIPKIVPNATSWRNIDVGVTFTVVRKMETYNNYGWPTASDLKADGTFTTDNNGIDTHLMKNVEWGAVVYLSKSQYGKNAEQIYINNSNLYTTGCAGDTVSEAAYDGCQNSYETDKGIMSSTTGTIYGIYDMSGGASERTASYIDTSTVTSYGLTVKNAIERYKDVYERGTDDIAANNYAKAINKKGDAIWETSNSHTGNSTWFGNYSNMSNINPWFLRGGGRNNGVNAGPYFFSYSIGNDLDYIGFRPVLVVDNDL